MSQICLTAQEYRLCGFRLSNQTALSLNSQAEPEDLLLLDLFHQALHFSHQQTFGVTTDDIYVICHSNVTNHKRPPRHDIT